MYGDAGQCTFMLGARSCKTCTQHECVWTCITIYLARPLHRAPCVHRGILCAHQDNDYVHVPSYLGRFMATFQPYKIKITESCRRSWCSKNVANRSGQHAGKQYRDNAQRRPLPHSNINVKFCTSRLCMKMSSLLFVRAWAMPRISYLSCGVPFSVWTPDNISGLISVVLWLLRWEVIKKKSGNILLSGWGK